MPGGRVIVIRGDAASLPLPDESVDLIVTSPPYWALRSYSDGGEHYDGQIGSEATPREFLDALWACTRDWIRVLKPEGSIWVNLGDKYSERSGPGHAHGRGDDAVKFRAERPRRKGPAETGVPAKSLIGLPWRYALGCIDDLGLILRAEIVWCLSGGARVYARTPTGDRPVMLRDLARSYRPENVQLWNGERWTQVLGWNRTPDRDAAIELELRTGERIGCTTGHRWPTNRGVIRADEIRIGDVIQTTRLPEPEQPRQPAALADDDIGWLVGLYMAEGSRSEKTLQFAGHVREDARHARLARIAAAYDGQAAVYQNSENGVTCNLSGSVLLGIIDRYIGAGRTARSKRLRHTVWQRSNEFLAALAEGYLSGDGHYDAKNDRWRLGFTQNDEWAADLRTLTARLGAKLSLRRHDHMFAGRKYPGWRGEWRWTRSAHRNAKQDGEVVAIRVSRAREFYDVGVADDPHLFALASGVLTHNSKPNGLPESVTDRVRRSHEQVFHFTKSPRYFAAVDEVRETYSERTQERQRYAGRGDQSTRTRGGREGGNMARGILGLGHEGMSPLGKLPGSVWEIPSQPLTAPAELGIDHFAAFPMELPRRIILGWSPSGICTACGEGRRPVAEKSATGRTEDPSSWSETVAYFPADLRAPIRKSPFRRGVTSTITGYACACPDASAPTRPALVLDPFSGTGTTMLAASVLGRTGMGVDRSADYCRLAQWRTADPAERARALGVPKPPPVPEGQGSLFDDIPDTRPA